MPAQAPVARLRERRCRPAPTDQSQDREQRAQHEGDDPEREPWADIVEMSAGDGLQVGRSMKPTKSLPAGVDTRSYSRSKPESRNFKVRLFSVTVRTT